MLRIAQEHPEWILRDDRGGEVSCGFTAPGILGSTETVTYSSSNCYRNARCAESEFTCQEA